MRVLHINLAKGWRGGERQTLLLMQGLRSLGVECALVARAPEPLAQRAREAGFEVTTPRPPLSVHWGAASAFDLVHAHEARALQVAAVWKWMNEKPLVATRRVDFAPSRGPLTRFKYAQADRLVAISSGVRDVMAAWGARADSLRVIHSAVSIEDQSRPARVEALRARFAGRRVIGCVAALVGHKDHATLLRAARILERTRPEVLVVLVGQGELRAALETQVRELRLGNIVFEGYQEDPYSYFRVFDAFALTSREEGLGTSILDAFAYGVPVVATRAGGIPELVKAGESGLLAEIGDDESVARALCAVLDDRELRETLQRGARALLNANFTVERMAARYAELYEEVTGSRV